MCKTTDAIEAATTCECQRHAKRIPPSDEGDVPDPEFVDRVWITSMVLVVGGMVCLLLCQMRGGGG